MRHDPAAPVGRLYLAPLDGLRFLAFTAVWLHHLPAVSTLPVLAAVQAKGWAGVELFFAISAYLFFTLFREEHHRTGRIAVGDFFLRRLLRIYPLMIVATLLLMRFGIPGSSWPEAWHEFAAIALFVDNLIWRQHFWHSIPPAGHLWTLSFEFQVYLVLPFLFGCCVRLGTRRGAILLGGLWLACVALRWWYALQDPPHPLIYYTPWLRPDSIMLGLLLALAAPAWRHGSGWAAAALVVGTASFAVLPNVFVPGWTHVPLYLATATMAGSLLWLALRMRALGAFLSTRPMVYLGKRSYGLYVFHVPVINALEALVLPHFPGLAASPLATFLVVLALSAVATAALASVSYRILERPFLQLKERFTQVVSRPI